MILNGENSIQIRQATPADNEGLIRLAELTPMRGRISVRVDRTPDFFGLLRGRGAFFVGVAVLESEIVGAYSVSSIPVFIGGEPMKVHYLADFRVHPAFRNSMVAMRLARDIMHRLQYLNANFIFSAVISGNHALSTFLTGNQSLPLTFNAGGFDVYQLIPTPFKKRSADFQINESFSDSSCLAFFNDFLRRFQLAPVLSNQSFAQSTLLTAQQGNELVAAVCLVDIHDKKQEVLNKLPFGLKITSVLTGAVLPFVRLPKEKEKVNLLYIRAFACKPGFENALKVLLSRATNIAFEKKYHFVAVGIHQKNPWKSLFAHFPKFRFQSDLFVGSMKNDKSELNPVLEGIPWLDFSLI